MTSIASASSGRFPRLDRDLDVDVVVIGGGVAGATAGYRLTRSGMTVALVERHRCARADSHHSSAHLTFVTDRTLTTLVDELGEDHARAYWDAGRAALLEIGDIVAAEGIDCGYARVPAYRHAPAAGRGRPGAAMADLEREAALATRLGFPARFLAEVPTMDRPGVVFDDQARIEPQRYIRALIDRIAVEGGYVFEDSPVIEILDDPVRVVCGAHVIRGRDVVLATDAPVLRQSRQAAAPVRQPPICRRPNRAVVARVPPGWLPDAFFRDTAAPSRQLRVQPGADSDLVVYGGADSRGASGLDSRLRFEHLADELRRVVPEADVLDGWSGLVSTPADGLPLIGYTAPHRFAMTGFDGNALTLGTLAGLMAWDALRGRRNPWQHLFDPARTGVRRGAWDYLKENADHSYYLIRDWVATAVDQPNAEEAASRSFEAFPQIAGIGAT